MKNPVAFLVCFFACLVTTSSFAGKFYKWVDEKGNTHYSQNPPPAQQAKVVKTYNDKGHSQPIKKAGEEKVAKADTAMPVAKKDKALCKKARDNQKALESQPMIMQEGKIMSVDQRNEQIKAAQSIIKVHC
ncbi:MAG: DUF4124 domain-containing protein [Cellvibrionales bacterium]|nr:DUF4124 domain-containing protein [Cellvibrionales bacterium]